MYNSLRVWGDSMKLELNSLDLAEMKNLMELLGEKSYRGEQLFRFFNQNNGISIDEIMTLPTHLREKLNNIGFVNKSSILKRLDSNLDGTKKYLILLEGGSIIESVLMVYEYGYSICLSTQVGCKMGCEFCASTKDGFIRNLSTAEILNQVYLIEKDLKIVISNIVLMGSGEPLDNFTNLLKFLEIIHHDFGRKLSYRNITISTCGIVPKIYELANENIPITLSISLHSPFDKERAKIMPIAKKYKIKELMDAASYYIGKTNRRITFEYTLIENVNDRDEDIKELIRLMKGLNAHINLIPLNPIKEYSQEATISIKVKKILARLRKNNIQASIRSEKGKDISGSCGQLRNNYLEDQEYKIMRGD